MDKGSATDRLALAFLAFEQHQLCVQDLKGKGVDRMLARLRAPSLQPDVGEFFLALRNKCILDSGGSQDFLTKPLSVRSIMGAYILCADAALFFTSEMYRCKATEEAEKLRDSVGVQAQELLQTLGLMCHELRQGPRKPLPLRLSKCFLVQLAAFELAFFELFATTDRIVETVAATAIAQRDDPRVQARLTQLRAFVRGRVRVKAEPHSLTEPQPAAGRVRVKLEPHSLA